MTLFGGVTFLIFPDDRQICFLWRLVILFEQGKFPSRLRKKYMYSFELTKTFELTKN